MMIPRAVSRLLVLCSVFAAAGHCIADTPHDQGPNLHEFVDCRLHVTDSEANPVLGATVRPVGFRTIVERGSHWAWIPARHGPRPTRETDEDGNVTIRVPMFVVEKMTIGEVSWIVEHPDHVTYYGDHQVSEQPATIILEDGFRVAARVVSGETDEVIVENIYGVLSGGRRSSTEWTLSDNGTLVSRVLDFERTHLRIVHLPKAGPALFSELLEVKPPEGGDRVFLRRIPLEAGIRLVGKLDNRVPRPVNNGHVTAFVSSMPHAQNASRQQHWTWWDKAPIQEDGTFVFSSLPKNEVVQLVAVCDGWVSAEPTEEDLRSAVPWVQEIARLRRDDRVTPQVYMLGEHTSRIEVEMQPTAVCQVTVVRPDGEPLPDAKVSMWPNQIWYRGGSTIVGVGFRSADLLRQGSGRDDVDWLKLIDRFSATTDAQGVATLVNLPGKPDIGLGVEHNDFEHPIDGGTRSTTVALEPGKLTRIKIQMQPKGTDVLGK